MKLNFLLKITALASLIACGYLSESTALDRTNHGSKSNLLLNTGKSGFGVKSLLVVLLLIFSAGTYNITLGCDQSTVAVDYIIQTSPGVYEMKVDWCVGTTTSAGSEAVGCGFANNGSTYEMAIQLNGGTGVNYTSFSPSGFTSGETGNSATGAISSSTIVTYSTGNQATLLHDGAATTSPSQFCYSATVTFTATTQPTSLKMLGLENDCGATGAQNCNAETVAIPTATTVTSCSDLNGKVWDGYTIGRDSTQNYISNMNEVITICPNTMGVGAMVINFYDFETEGGFGDYDYVEIFNGISTSLADRIGPLYKSTNTPNGGADITSTDPTGCLTIRLTTDGSANYKGYKANVICPVTCILDSLKPGTQTACVKAGNSYTQEVIVYYSDAPTTGTLDVNGQSFAIGTSPQTVTLTNLNADGNAVNVTASFSDDVACTLTENNLFTAPAFCGCLTNAGTISK